MVVLYKIDIRQTQLRKKMTKKTLLLIMLCGIANTIHAGCGGCSTNRSHSTSYNTESKGLVEAIPANKFIKGNVIISCGMCNFMTNDNDCSMAIKIGKGVYNVSGVNINEHGDSHATDGYCNVIKKVYVEGRVSGNRFIPVKMNTQKM